jgi:hypothetical protein
MNGSTAALFFGILIIAIGSAWVLTGGLAAPAELASPPEPTPGPVTIPMTTLVTTPVPVTIAAPPVPATTVPAIPTTTVTKAPTVVETPVSADQVRDHFLAIAYSATNRLERLNYTENQDRLIISVVTPSGTDMATLSAVAQEFNEVSRTVKISENIKESSNGDIVIKFLPENGLANILLDDIPDAGPETEVLTRHKFMQDGKPAAKIVRGAIYINSNLAGDTRNHIIARSLYYQLGVTGDSAGYPGSLFYAGENANTKLNEIDRKAVAILYEPGLANTMTMEDLRKVIYIP